MAGRTGLQVFEALHELVLERPQPLSGFAGLVQLLLEEDAHLLHRHRGRPFVLEIAQPVPHFRQGQAEILQHPDPANAGQRLFMEEAITALRPGRRLQEAELLIVMNGAHGLAAALRQLTYLEQPLRLAHALRLLRKFTQPPFPTRRPHPLEPYPNVRVQGKDRLLRDSCQRQRGGYVTVALTIPCAFPAAASSAPGAGGVS